MRIYGEANNRPDLVLHSACVEQREKLEGLGDEFEVLVQCRDIATLPETLQKKIRLVYTYLLTGAWNEFSFPYPEDGIFEEGRRLKEAVEAARPGYVLGASMIAMFEEEEPHTFEWM